MTKKELESRLKNLDSKLKEIQRQIHEVYKESINSSEKEKLCPDWVAERLLCERKTIEYPIVVNGIHRDEIDVIQPSLMDPLAKWVAVRPVEEEYKGKTYLGIMLGDIATHVSCYFNEDGILSIGLAGHNPAMYVPDLNKIIWGYGSWWREIKTEKDLQKITDKNINNTWYVRALKEICLDGR